MVTIYPTLQRYGIVNYTPKISKAEVIVNLNDTIQC